MSNGNIQSDQGDGARERPEHAPPWKLNVQNVIIEVKKPEIKVRAAILEAGFSIETPWIMVLKVAGEPRREVSLDDVIDLRKPGIEKLRLTPKQINNGEGGRPFRREFALLPKDEVLLSRMRVGWETALDNGRRWLLLYGYPLPAGLSTEHADIAIEVPASYPAAQLDMFFCRPHLKMKSGAGIPQTEHVETIFGETYQRWSRHRAWDAAHDTLATHLALVDESLRREVGA